MQYAEGSGEKTIRVLVADDTRIHTQLLADALRRSPEFEVLSSPSHSQDLIEFAKLQTVDVMVLSSTLDEQPLRGCDTLRELRTKNPAIRAVMLLDSSRREVILGAFRAGARGILSRHESVETLQKCIHSVYQGQIWANSQQMSFAVEALASFPSVCAVDANGLDLLSKREMDVVRSLAEGLTNREIAERLGLSQHTIKNYLFRVFDKLGVSSRLELLFMTLTQAGTLQAGAASEFEHNANGNGHRTRRRPAAASRRGQTKPSVIAARPTEETLTRRAGGLDVRMRYVSHKEQPRLARKEQGSEGQTQTVVAAVGGDDLG
jgi:DNA-binding NarL/FixJ family response regulator